MTKSADPDQLAIDLDVHCLQWQGIPRFSRTKVNLGSAKPEYALPLQTV